ERSASSTSRMSSTADCKVRSMLVPVSPSGTGKTLRASTSSRLTVSQASEPSRASLNKRPLHSVMGMVAAPVRLGISAAATPADMDTLDVDVDFHDRESEGALDRIPDGVPEVVGHLRDPRAVLHDDVQRNAEPTLTHLDLDAPMQFVAVQALGQAISQAAGSHGDNAVAARRRMPGNGGDPMGGHLQ